MGRVWTKDGPDETGTREKRDHVARFEVVYALRRVNNGNLSSEEVFGKLVERKRRENSAIVL